MVDITVAQELEEDVASVEASIGDLVGAEEFVVMAGLTWEFRESMVIAKDIAEMVEEEFFKEIRGKLPLLVRSCLSQRRAL
jgi:hypothetical protein